MGVFLRWGVFGIVAIAALMYAYNASKRLSEQRAARNPPVVSQESGEEVDEDEATDGEPAEESATTEEADEESEPEVAMPELCAEEQRVAERALKMRRDGDRLDRLLRIDIIVFQSEEQRSDRLKAVATKWFGREGRDPNASMLRAEVLRDCRKAMAAPGPVTPAPTTPAP